MKAKGYVMKYMTNAGIEEEVSLEQLFGWIWDDFCRGNVDRENARGLLKDLGLNSTDVFHMLELLGMGKEEFEKGDYQERSYI